MKSEELRIAELEQTIEELRIEVDKKESLPAPSQKGTADVQVLMNGLKEFREDTNRVLKQMWKEIRETETTVTETVNAIKSEREELSAEISRKLAGPLQDWDRIIDYSKMKSESIFREMVEWIRGQLRFLKTFPVLLVALVVFLFGNLVLAGWSAWRTEQIAMKLSQMQVVQVVPAKK